MYFTCEHMPSCSLHPTCRFLTRPASAVGDLYRPVVLRKASCAHAASRKQRRLRPPAATDGAHEDSANAEELTDIDEDQILAPQEQDAAVDTNAATTAAPATPAQPTATQQHASTAKTQQRRMVSPSISPDFVTKAKLGGLAVVGVAAAVGVGLMLRKVASAQMPKMQKVQAAHLPLPSGMRHTLCQVMEQRQLQKESMQRLNSFMEQVRMLFARTTHTQSPPQIRSSPSADLSAKNLGEEGCQYIAEAFAFNDRCKAADLGKNGIGAQTPACRVVACDLTGVQGVTQLCEALTQNDYLQTLILETNSIGDDGARVLAAFMEGA